MVIDLSHTIISFAEFRYDAHVQVTIHYFVPAQYRHYS
jgi:hypothetical protein